MLLILLIFGVSSVICEGPTIHLLDGTIEGLTAYTIRDKTEFYAYLGIPFAAPPIGQLRMKPPHPVQPWNGTFEAKDNKKICYQISSKVHYPQTEDCLILNVYTPIKPGQSGGLPVMVSIYGGSFTHGFASIGTTGPDYFLEAGIILVTFNYRVGPFGFLSTDDDTIPGNMGVKDQVFALKWVQKNIHLFGGNPDKVTIHGQSAGAASVTYHILSPASKGLFRAAIANSGSALNSWANVNGSGLHVARGIARIIDPTMSKTATPKEIYDLLMRVDAEEIHKTGSNYAMFAPVIEGKHEGAFITESMYELLESGRFNRVPLVIGFNSEEYISLASNEAGLRSSAKTYDSNPATLVNRDLRITDAEILKKAGSVIKNVYTGTSDFEHHLGEVIRFRSDDMFIRGVIRYAQMQAKYDDVYLYQFSYHGLLGRNNLTYEGCGRVEHGEDGRYLWAGADLSKYPASDVTTVERYVGFFTNFIKTLNPTPNKEELFQNVIWPRLNADNIHFMDIDDNLSIKQHPRNAVYEKWVTIYGKYAVEPLLTF